MKIQAARLSKNEVITVYSRTASVYDLWGVLTESKARKRSLELAQIQNGQSVLEVAVGTGLTFQALLRANPGGYTAGVDLTPAMLEKARARAEQIGGHFDISVGDAYRLKFGDHQFDVLMNNYMFDLLPESDFSRVLAEFRRVLKPGGRLVLVNMTKGTAFYQSFWETLYRINPTWLGGCRGVVLAQPLENAGFAHVHREVVSQLGFPSEILTATA